MDTNTCPLLSTLENLFTRLGQEYESCRHEGNLEEIRTINRNRLAVSLLCMEWSQKKGPEKDWSMAFPLHNRSLGDVQ